MGALDGTGAFSVPLASDLHGADCVAQLHSAASNVPCAGQEKIPVSQKMAAYSKRSCMSLRERTGRSVI